MGVYPLRTLAQFPTKTEVWGTAESMDRASVGVWFETAETVENL